MYKSKTWYITEFLCYAESSFPFVEERIFSVAAH